MSDAIEKSSFWAGFRGSLPFLLVVVPFGVLFGVVATEAGLSVVQVMAFTSIVFAGASQFAALQLMVNDAPILIVVITALAVNLRMAMYSASLAVWIGGAPLWQRALVAYINIDQSYAVSIGRFEAQPEMTLRQRLAFFFGSATPICPMWIVATAFGIWLGEGLPAWMALDFAVPICFLAIIAPMMRTLAHVLAAATSIVLALAFAFLPYNLGLLGAAGSAMIVGARVELWSERRKHLRAQP